MSFNSFSPVRPGWDVRRERFVSNGSGPSQHAVQHPMPSPSLLARPSKSVFKFCLLSLACFCPEGSRDAVLVHSKDMAKPSDPVVFNILRLTDKCT